MPAAALVAAPAAVLEFSRACDRAWRAVAKKLFTLLDLCVSSLRRGHANLLCIVPILTDDPRRESNDLVQEESGRLEGEDREACAILEREVIDSMYVGITPCVAYFRRQGKARTMENTKITSCKHSGMTSMHTCSVSTLEATTLHYLHELI